MPTRHVIEGAEDALLISWASDLDPKALEQAKRSARMPFVEGHVALMPDAHWGLGATVGSVIPTRGAIIPSAVGVDIGCGMIAVETSLTASNLPDDLGGLLRRIERVIPAGVGKGHDHSSHGETWLAVTGTPPGLQAGEERRVVQQFGTLGSGNHFVEVSVDETEVVWLVLHSGSRGIGNRLAMRHIATAKELMARNHIALEDRDLAYLTEGSAEFDAYMTDLHWAQDYALANRERMMDALLGEFRTELAIPDGSGIEMRRINCHHNYTARELHFGKQVWVTRKGAIRAREGDWGVIPGSMGTDSFIVEGLGNPDSFQSSAHGAGRRMSRSEAKRRFTPEGLAERMRGKTWLAKDAKALLDEDPRSYKDIETVIRDQSDLVRVDRRLVSVLNYKGT